MEMFKKPADVDKSREKLIKLYSVAVPILTGSWSKELEQMWTWAGGWSPRRVWHRPRGKLG